MTGTVERIYIIKQRREVPQQVESAVLEASKGIVGDRYHQHALECLDAGDEVQQNHLSLIEQEQLDAFLVRNNAEIDYGNFRRNIVTSGIDLNALVGKQFRVGHALCMGVEFCEPCAFLAATVHRAVLPELEEKAGLRAVVLEDGSVDAGNEIVPAQD